MKQRLKELTKTLLFKYNGYGFSQKRWFRKFYGGEWNMVHFDVLELSAWVQGEPDPYLKHDRILETENWQS